MKKNPALKVRGKRIGPFEVHDKNKYGPLMYVRFADKETGQYIGSINTKSQARRLIEILKNAEFWR